uniref:Protein E6 n=1 Tax=Human papillomavirus 45 TaxID=10593 RepID=M4H3S9_HPV45|nr:E6 [human papillomavirus 45]AHB20609.1 early protein E6 [human papillomavirus 45]
MARFDDPTQRPYKLPDLCTELNTSLQDVSIACVYCKATLERTEVYQFAFKDLFIVYRDCIAYAACHKCIDFYSRIRELRYYSNSVYGETLEKITNTELYNLLIRCLRCQKPLNPAEKRTHLKDKRRFHSIAGQYRGQCNTCCDQARQERLRRRRETQV